MKISEIINSFRYAWSGISFTVKNERNMRIHLCFTVAVIFCSVIFDLTLTHRAIVIGLCGCVMCAELLNTAVENFVDMMCPTFNMYARRAKDAAAGAVLIMSIAAAVAGLIIFIPYGLKALNIM